MNIVFLDIDGVINTLQIDENLQPYLGNEETGPNNIQAIRWLNKLCLSCHAKIVISSSWRHMGFQKCRDCLYASGLSKDIEIIDFTPTTFGERGEEIGLWLKVHPEVERFVILDDDTDMAGLEEHLIKCNQHIGFSADEYNQACCLLSGTILL